MSVVTENLRRDATMRMGSDTYMSAAWVIVPILPIIGFILFWVSLFAAAFTFTPPSPGTTPSPVFFGTFFAVFIIFEIAIFVIGIIFAVLIYKLVKRRNTHFARQQFLYEDMINMTKALAGKKGVDLSLPLNNLDRTYREARVEETEKSAALWAILSFITGIATLYVAYFLMKDFFKHERKEDLFFDDLNRALVASGVTLNLPRRTVPVPDRSFILYFILSIITAGLFYVYWTYVLLEDPNNHYRHQAVFEDTIISQVTPLIS